MPTVVDQRLPLPSGLAGRILAAAYRDVAERGRLDVVHIAARARVGRSSMYRLVGTREELRTALLVVMARGAWALSVQDAGQLTGAARCRTAMDAFCRRVSDHAVLRALLVSEPEATLRVLTDPRGSVQPVVISLFADVMTEEVDRGLIPVLPLSSLAFALVRLAESFVYADVLADRSVDLRALSQLFGQLLGPPGTSPVRPRGGTR